MGGQAQPQCQRLKPASGRALHPRTLGGSLGGKLTGAGGGGFLLLFAPPDRQAKLRAELSDLLHVPVDFEHSGSQIIFYEPEQDYAAEERERARQTLSAFRELGGEAT